MGEWEWKFYRLVVCKMATMPIYGKNLLKRAWGCIKMWSVASVKNNEKKILMNVICCGHDWRFKGQGLRILLGSV